MQVIIDNWDLGLATPTPYLIIDGLVFLVPPLHSHV